MLLRLLLCILLLAPTSALCFTIPERLEFDITWTGIKAGTAIQELSREGSMLKILSTVRSTDWLSTFFHVEDHLETTLTTGTDGRIGLPTHYRMKVKEGRHVRDKEIIFDRGAKQAVIVDNIKKERTTVAISPATVDTYTSFYLVRGMKLEVGKPVYVDIVDSKKQWRVEVEVLRKERITTRLGTFNTVVIKPRLKSEGIFDQKGEMLVWLTDDDRHLPVKMKSKVIVGSVSATLVGGRY
jgi:hypothetical protein